MQNMLPYGEYAFVTHAPGDTELYVIPNRWMDDFLKWCECELFDQQWMAYKEFFAAYKVEIKAEGEPINASMLHTN